MKIEFQTSSEPQKDLISDESRRESELFRKLSERNVAGTAMCCKLFPCFSCCKSNKKVNTQVVQANEKIIAEEKLE